MYMNDIDQILDKIEKFLNRLENGEFRDNEEQAIEQLNLLCQNEECRDFLISEYFPSKLKIRRSGQAHINYLSEVTLKYSAPSLANALTEALIDQYFLQQDEEILALLVEIILAYNLYAFLSIENEGRNIRFKSQENSFAVRTDLVRSELRLNLLRVSLGKYSRILAKEDPPSAQEIQPIILRFNTIVNSLNDFKAAEIVRYPTLFAIGLTDNISQSSSNSSKLFQTNLNALDYDERLFTEYGIPLLPVINKDKIEFNGQSIHFQNEGLGTLPPFSVVIMVGENEFEFGENLGFIKAESTKNFYADDPATFTEFLKTQSPNSDIKINFIFKKFSKSYEYSVLAEPVGDWLQKSPVKNVELAIPFEAPLEKLSPKEFERLCFWISEEYKDAEGTNRFEKVVWLGEDGGGEQGRDVIANEVKTNKHFVFQCKRVEKFRPYEIAEELNAFQDYVTKYPEIKPDVYILFVSTGISAETKRRGDRIAQQMGIEIDYWTKSKIDRLVRRYDNVKKRFWRVIEAK